MPSDRHPIELGAKRVRYRSPKAINSELLDDEDGRITDTNRDALRSVVKETLKTNQPARIPIELVFEPGSSTLSNAHREAIDLVVGVLEGRRVGLRIDGFGFDEGRAFARIVALSRAIAVGRYIRTEHRVAEDHIQCVGFGSGENGRHSRENKVVQNRLGRRIALIYIVPLQD
jgi:hypothetical protein